MNLSVSNIAWDVAQNDAVYSHISAAAAWAADMRSKYGFAISSMQSIWYGRSEKLFGTEAERTALLEYTKRAVDFAAAIGCKNLVFGCPKNRNKPDNADEEISVRFFREIGDYAAAKNTCVALEANPAIYGTNFVNTTHEAIALIRAVNSDGFKLNLDVGTMIQNGEPVSVLSGNADLIHHVHISEPLLKKIEPRRLHNDLLSFLRTQKYAGFVSVEMGLQEHLSDIEDVMKYVGDKCHAESKK